MFAPNRHREGPRPRASRNVPGLGTAWVFSLWGAVVALSGSPARAQVPHPAHPDSLERARVLSLQEAVREASSVGPAVRVAQAPQAGREAALRNSHPPFQQVPVIQVQLGPRISSGSTTPEVVVGLSQPVPLMNVARAQRDLAHAEHQAQLAGLHQTRLEAALAAGACWIDLALSEVVLELRESAVEEAESTLHFTQARVQAGDVDPGELALARGEVAAVQAAVLDAEEAHFAAASRLGFLTRTQIGVQVESRGDLGDFVDGAERREDGFDETQHPALQAALKRSQASDEAVRYAAVNQSPSFSFGVQYQREGTGDQVVTGLLSVPLPLWKPWTFAEHRQRATSDAHRVEVDVVREEVQRAYERAEHEHAHARARYYLLRDSSLPAAAESLRVETAKYEKGETDVLRLSLTRRVHLSVREHLAQALADVARAELTLRGLAGTLLEAQS